MSLHFIEKKRTIIGKGGWRKNSYWGNSGSYQKEYKELYDKLVPPQGECDTIHGELVRCIGKLQYDYGNNGWCNTLFVMEMVVSMMKRTITKDVIIVMES